MVAPKAATNKEKNKEKTAVSASPEPFQEPDGMTTIDLNKSDDYSKEVEHERAKQKQRAQMRYVAQLIFVLGTIFIVVLTMVIFGFLSKRYHIYPPNQIQLNESEYYHKSYSTPSPTEEFVNLTKILNQALFKDKLKSGTYLDNSYEEMNLCKLEQTVDACCTIFKNTDLHGLAEFCTVNDMLNILLEYELDPRKKRQVGGFDEYNEVAANKQSLKTPHSLNVKEKLLLEQPNHQFSPPHFQRVGLVDPNIKHPSNIQNNLQMPEQIIRAVASNGLQQNNALSGPQTHNHHQTSEVHTDQVEEQKRKPLRNLPPKLNLEDSGQKHEFIQQNQNNHQMLHIMEEQYHEPLHNLPTKLNVENSGRRHEFIPQNPNNHQMLHIIEEQKLKPLLFENSGQNHEFIQQNQNNHQMPVIIEEQKHIPLQNLPTKLNLANSGQNHEFIHQNHNNYQMPHVMEEQKHEPLHNLPTEFHLESSGQKHDFITQNHNNHQMPQIIEEQKHQLSRDLPTKLDFKNSRQEHEFNPQNQNNHQMPYIMEEQKHEPSHDLPTKLDLENSEQRHKFIPQNQNNHEMPHIMEEQNHEPLHDLHIKLDLENSGKKHEFIPQNENTHQMPHIMEEQKLEPLHDLPTKLDLENSRQEHEFIPQNQNNHQMPHIMEEQKHEPSHDLPTKFNIKNSGKKHKFNQQNKNHHQMPLPESIAPPPRIFQHTMESPAFSFNLENADQGKVYKQENSNPEANFENKLNDHKVQRILPIPEFYENFESNPFYNKTAIIINQKEDSALPISWLKTNTSINFLEKPNEHTTESPVFSFNLENANQGNVHKNENPIPEPNFENKLNDHKNQRILPIPEFYENFESNPFYNKTEINNQKEDSALPISWLKTNTSINVDEQIEHHLVSPESNFNLEQGSNVQHVQVLAPPQIFLEKPNEHTNESPASSFNLENANQGNVHKNENPIPEPNFENKLNDHKNQRILPIPEFYENFESNPFYNKTEINNQKEDSALPISWLKTNTSINVDEQIEQHLVSPESNFNLEQGSNVQHVQLLAPPQIFPEKPNGHTTESPAFSFNLENANQGNVDKNENPIPEPNFENKLNDHKVQRILPIPEFYENFESNPFNNKTAINNQNEDSALPISWLKTNMSDNIKEQTVHNLVPPKSNFVLEHAGNFQEIQSFAPSQNLEGIPKKSNTKSTFNIPEENTKTFLINPNDKNSNLVKNIETSRSVLKNFIQPKILTANHFKGETTVQSPFEATASSITIINKQKEEENDKTIDDYPTQNTDETFLTLSRSNQQGEFRGKTKQLESLASEDIQSNQQAFVNPCYNPYMNPYMSFMPPPARVANTQETGYLKIVQVSPQKSQNQPMYVLNPAMYYGMPQNPSPQLSYPNYPVNPYMPSGFFPSLPAQTTATSSPVQVASSGGQYFMCNPIPTPTNNIANLAGIEVRRASSNLQSLMDNFEIVAVNKNKSRASSAIICPLGEQLCLDNSKCIKNYHICDSEVHCDDSSDEIACTCKERVGKLRLCDGYCDCPKCEDEQACFGCSANEFSCDDWSRFRRSTCIPLVQRCDGIKQCEVTGKDEIDCSMLADHIGNFPLNTVSNSVGFLHRNYKGKWYPTCFGTELWAAQVCTVEAGPSTMIPKAHMTLTTDPYDGFFINILPNNEVSLVDTCVQDRAAFVECPPIYCGLRFLVNNPYRTEEVDTSIEDMLSDLERAYKMKENGFERKDFETDLHEKKKFHQRSLDDPLDKEEVIENLEKTFARRHISEEADYILKNSRVVGGKPSQPAAWPWLVSIYKNGIFHCGGVLINELWIVTASHCVDRYWQYYYEIQAGALRRFSYSPMDQRRWATVIIAHEFYSKTNLRSDIALMKLSAPIRYNRYVRPICLPSETTSGKDYLKSPTAGTICTTVGWGATVEHGADPDHMREVEVPILHHCKHKEDSDTEEICAGLTEGGRDACQGDSGGPLMCRNPNNPNQWYLAGIVSHGDGCARPNEPGVYTRVSRYMGWIAENTREDKVTTMNPLQRCPGYTCKGTKRCVPKKRRCDRIIDCLLGDDEMDCENQYKDFFKHSNKNLFSPINTNDYDDYDDNAAELDNGNFEILERKRNSTDSQENKFFDYLEDQESLRINSDEQNTEFEEKYFKCEVLLQVIPIEKKCNKIFDCEDGSDETDCTCADYIRTTDAKAICDGVADCDDISDESDCNNCNNTEFYCPFSKKCIELTNRCDGGADCPLKEDEMNCVSLTSGHNVTLDKDNRPIFKSRGIATINHEGQWKPLCLNKSSQFAKNEPTLATIFCTILGFDEYLTYHRYRIEDININSSYSMVNGRAVQDYEQSQCENCCDGLYISCSNISTGTTLQHQSLEQVKELYFSPWMAAIYFNGEYKCMGTLLDKLWIVTSVNCVKDNSTIKTNYITAVLGKGKLHITEKGPQEQVIRISSSININGTDIVLLRLKNEATFTRYVQATNLNARRDGLQIEKCYAIGQDNENKVMFVPLTPLKNCLIGYRCFEKKIEEDCQDNHSWSGVIICDARMDWYPAAVFSEEKGHCGFSHTKKYTSIKFYKNEIFKAMEIKLESILPPPCLGFQCSLGNCIKEEKICDDINDCHNGEDEEATLCYEKEKQCHLENKCVCSSTDLKCPTTNKCFPKSSFCDRTNNCGEFEDEPNTCSCRNYLKLTNPEKICDGTLNCLDRSDEDSDICSCKLGDFQCGKLNKCVPQETVCDGVEDCPNGEDEATCLSLKTENQEKINAGEVMTKTAGVWHSGCFGLNYTTTQLEEMCTKLGFNGNSANQLTPPHSLTTLTTLRPVLDNFEVVWLRRQAGNKMKLRMRSGYNPYVQFVADKDCHRLFIACI